MIKEEIKDKSHLYKVDDLIDLSWNEAQKEFVYLLNHNKRKIFKGETRDVNEIFLDLDFLFSLIERVKK